MIKQKISSGAIYFDEKRTGDTMHISTNAFKPAVYAPLSDFLADASPEISYFIIRGSV